MRFKKQQAGDAENRARMALIDAMRPFADELGAERMLAVTAYLVGQLVALQDQSKMTPADAMNLVAQNITAGNQNVVDDLLNGSLGSA